MRFILLCLAGWVNREQQAVIEYLLEEIRVLKEIHGKRPRFSDAQRRRLAAKAKKLRYGKLKEIVNIATPQTLLRWFRLVATNRRCCASVTNERFSSEPSFLDSAGLNDGALSLSTGRFTTWSFA
jgi:hypothetical protein